MGFAAHMRRLQMLRQGRFRHWAELNVSALTRVRPCMTAENRQIFDLICEARHRPLLRRAAKVAPAGVGLSNPPCHPSVSAAALLPQTLWGGAFPYPPPS